MFDDKEDIFVIQHPLADIEIVAGEEQHDPAQLFGQGKIQKQHKRQSQHSLQNDQSQTLESIHVSLQIIVLIIPFFIIQ